MLLARSRQFNRAPRSARWLALVGVCFAAAASADEIRRWRDAEGKLHLSVTGSGGKETGDAAGANAVQRFSVEVSLRRHDLEKGLRTANLELNRVREEIREVSAKQLLVYSPPPPRDADDAQFVLDAQRNAFLQARAFEKDKEQRLRKLRRQERDWLVEMQRLWRELDALRGEVRQAYGQLPSWWRDRLDCPGCPTAKDVERELQSRRQSRSEAP